MSSQRWVTSINIVDACDRSVTGVEETTKRGGFMDERKNDLLHTVGYSQQKLSKVVKSRLYVKLDVLQQTDRHRFLFQCWKHRSPEYNLTHITIDVWYINLKCTLIMNVSNKSPLKTLLMTLMDIDRN